MLIKTKQGIMAYKKNDSHNDSVALYYPTALAYEAVGDLDKQTIFLAMAAIEDIENSKKSYIALRKLALILYQKGDFKYNYADNKKFFKSYKARPNIDIKTGLSHFINWYKEYSYIIIYKI